MILPLPRESIGEPSISSALHFCARVATCGVETRSISGWTISFLSCSRREVPRRARLGLFAQAVRVVFSYKLINNALGKEVWVCAWVLRQTLIISQRADSGPKNF
jgi:hypothetical protein